MKMMMKMVLVYALGAFTFWIHSSAFAAASKPAVLVIDGPSVEGPARSADEVQRFQQFEQFLQNTGFPDLSAQIAKTLSGPNADKLEQMNRETLEANWHRMQIVNFGRDLAAELLTQLAPTLGNADSAAKTAELAARLLSQKRLVLPDAFPDAIRNLRNYDQRLAAKEQYLRGAIEKNILRMQEQIVSDSLHTIYGREKVEAILNGTDSPAKRHLTAYIKRLDALAYRYVRSLYFDHEMGMGHWLGEAMALGLVHTSRLSKDPEVRKFEALLNARAYAHGEYLSDAVSNTLTFENEKGQRQQVTVHQADTITELYSVAQTSRLSAAAVRPHILNRWKAFRTNLLQSFIFAELTADETNSKWKAIDGKEPSLLDKIRQSLAGAPEAKIGASHAGMATVYRNAQSGVSVARAIDMYAFGPTPYGGARFNTIKTIFSAPGVFANFGVASLDPALTLDYLQKATRERGFQPTFKVSDVYRPNEKGEMVKSPGETFGWSPRISEEEQRKVLDVNKEDAEKWYTTDLAPRLAAEMTRYITEYGMAFRPYGESPSNKWACYCSEGVNIAGFRETGHNLQSHLDRIHFLARFARFVYPKLESKVYREQPISPNFMGWDPKTKTETVTYVDRSAVESWTEQVQAPRNDFDPGLTALISKFTDRTLQYNDMQFGQAKYGPSSLIENVEVSAVLHSDRLQRETFLPRVNGMGVATSEAPTLTYNLAPAVGLSADSAATSLQDLATRRSVHSTLMKAAHVAGESPAAGLIMAEIYPRLSDAATMSLMQAFAAKMMALKPINPPRLIPHEIKALPAHEREPALIKYLSAFTAQQIETHTRQILSDVAGILYGKESVERLLKTNLVEGLGKANSAPGDFELRQKISELYRLIGQEVTHMYLNPDVADARTFGVNLAVGLIHATVKTDHPENINVLGVNLKTYGLRTQDFFAADLGSQAVINSLRLGDVKVLAPIAKPGQKQRERMSQAVNGRELRQTERAQLRYSPYAEVQPEMTRALDTLFNAKPQFATLTFTAAENQNLLHRMADQYLTPLNEEQMGKNGTLYNSEFLRANPVAPKAPQYLQGPLTCEALFAS